MAGDAKAFEAIIDPAARRAVVELLIDAAIYRRSAEDVLRVLVWAWFDDDGVQEAVSRLGEARLLPDTPKRGAA